MDEALLHDWENEDFPVLDDDQLDFAIASSLQSQYDAQISKNTKDDSFLLCLDEDLDYAFALSLQSEFTEDLKENIDAPQKTSFESLSKSSKPLSIVDKQWELIDPHPDVHALFLQYDKKFFYGKLQGVIVKWSPRMTLCAGVCCYEGRGGLCSIRLSVPLLKLRPRRDLVETLLHEMIHAYLFVTHNNKDREGHGPEFLSHMNRINKETGTRISVYHSFHDEVDMYRTHWWKCDGPCRNRRPFYGIVKRAMNREPGPRDNWWAAHQQSCGGKFVKIKEPEGYKKKAQKRKPSSDNSTTSSIIKKFFSDNISDTSKKSGSSSTPLVTKSSNISTIASVLSKESNMVPVKSEEKFPKNSFVPFHGSGQKLGGSVQNSLLSSFTTNGKKLPSTSDDDKVSVKVHSFPKTSKSSDLKNTASTSRKTDSKPVLVQSPIQKFFSPKKENLQKKLDASSSAAIIPVINIESEDSSDTLNVNCPICTVVFKSHEINSHIDQCLQN